MYTKYEMNVNLNNNKKIAVIHGGTSHEREKSLQYGKKITSVLENLGLEVMQMHLHPNGSWTINGEVKSIEEGLKKVDAVWNCLVGVDGERAIVENLCTKCKTKIIGHGVLHSELAGDKKNLQLALNQHNIKTPYGKVIRKKDYSKESLLEVFGSVGIPAFVKPSLGSGLENIYLVENFQELQSAVEEIIKLDMDVLVEKIIQGTPVSCFVLEHNNLLHTHIKVGNELDSGTPLSREDVIKVRNEALYIHSCLAWDHHVEYDFILSSKKGEKTLYFLEANTHPSLVHGYIKKSWGEGPVTLEEYINSKVL